MTSLQTTHVRSNEDDARLQNADTNGKSEIPIYFIPETEFGAASVVMDIFSQNSVIHFFFMNSTHWNFLFYLLEVAKLTYSLSMMRFE